MMVNNGNEAYMRKNYSETFRWYSDAANQGDADAQCILGEIYYNDTGIPQDQSLAKEWWEKAAAQGYAAAKENLEKYFKK